MSVWRVLAISLLILLAVGSRFLPHPPNFTPVMAVALFAGYQFRGQLWAFLIPFLVLLLSDLALGFYPSMWTVYLSFALIVGMGVWSREGSSRVRLVGSVFAAPVLFFVVTNFAVWALDGLYPLTVDGLVACYLAALPFFHNSLIANVLYSAALFGSWAWLEKRYPVLALN